MDIIVGMIDRVLSDPENEKVIATVRAEVNEMMQERPMFAW
jgi:glycine hydroxymethyltransferase